ncbi:hypothetical protein [Microvirga antarctica]|uniref:hypothetical protein n=1 Tax=Microvirga antarctica TaxID=2819233 RepID=UPI001B306744|nr:hypothetical protein [Microvirga antarctica]
MLKKVILTLALFAAPVVVHIQPAAAEPLPHARALLPSAEYAQYVQFGFGAPPPYGYRRPYYGPPRYYGRPYYGRPYYGPPRRAYGRHYGPPPRYYGRRYYRY